MHPSIQPIGLDNNDTVFQFDFTENPDIEDLASANREAPSASSQASGAMSPRTVRASASKGKAVSDPIDIPSGFSQAPGVMPSSLSLTCVASGPASSIHTVSSAPSTNHKGKGKLSDSPPCLPPLPFTSPEFSYSHIAWPTPSSFDSEAGPSSYGGSPPLGQSSPHGAIHVSPSPTISARPRTLSDSSTLSVATLSLSRIKLKSGLAANKPSGNLSHKLLFRKLEPSPASGVSADVTVLQSQIFQTHLDSETSLKDVSLSYGLSGQDATQGGSWSTANTLKGKGRSHSLPLPYSVLDLALDVSTETFRSPEQLVLIDRFDELPKEIRLHVLIALLHIHEADHKKLTVDPSWSTSKASSKKNVWLGREAYVRELVKFSRVSKTWQLLISDGGLWRHLDLRAFKNIPKSVILRLVSVAGSFIQSLDISGHVFMLPTTFTEITNRLCIQPSAIHTQLTMLNVRGCTMLTTHSLHHVLRSSPALEWLCAKGLAIVTNMTCEVLEYCPRIHTLDLGRCTNMDSNGIHYLVKAALLRKQFLPWRVLRLCGMKYVDDGLLSALGKIAPFLEVLDLSYCRLHNSALEAFVSCEEADTEENIGVDIVILNARQAGRELGDYNKYHRRVTRLRHLCVSFCVLLTDNACSNLAHSVPYLEFLEMAGIGDGLRDGGLIRLFETTPSIRRVDLEDASALSDAVLAALTPAQVEGDANPDFPQPGRALEHLTISYATNLTDNALLALIRGCTKLKILEADNSRIGSKVFKEFVRLSRSRNILNSRIVAVDCRTIGESSVKEMASMTRPRLGWRAYDARKLKYLDARDGDLDDLKVGQDECDEKRVVVKTFYSWQTVDSVKASREKRKKATSRRSVNGSGSSVEDPGSGSTRWWAPAGRRSGSASPIDMSNRDSCTIM